MPKRSEAEVRQLYHAIWGYKADEMRRLLDEKGEVVRGHRHVGAGLQLHKLLNDPINARLSQAALARI